MSFMTLSAAVDSVFTSLPQTEFEASWYATWDTGDWGSKAKNAYDMFDADVLLSNTLVITEFCQQSRNHYYVEFTNVGTEDVDLSKYIYAVRRSEKTPEATTASDIKRVFSIQMSGTLKPNETYILMGYRYIANTDPNIPDATVPTHNKYLERHGDIFIDGNDKKTSWGTIGTSYSDGTPVWHFGRSYDSYSVKSSKLNAAGALYKIVGDTAQVVVDCVEQITDGRATVAGVFNAINLNTMVRKKFTAGRTWGNPNFIIGSGRQAAVASEWILVPRYNTGTTNLFTTIGSHDPNSSYSITAKEGSNVVIDEANSTITVPYPTFRGDSIISSLILGNDMAWEFKTNGVAEEEASVIVHTADSITFYHCGEDVTIKSYRLEVGPPLPSSALLFSPDYNITFGLDVDTIYGDLLTYDYSVDSLLKYVQYSPGTDIAVSYVGGTERPLLKTLDKLVVTSADKTNTHEYVVKLLPYSTLLSNVARLTTITWPDYPVDELDEYVWTNGDTIPAFNPNGFNYIITLPEGTTEIPALTASVEHPRASMKIVSAKDLSGSVEDQTTKIIVTAEDDTTVFTYNVRFVVDQSDKQAYLGDPFFSELAENGDGSLMIEVVNPSTDLLDMSDYVMVGAKTSEKTLLGALKWNTDSFFRNCGIYRPGYVLDSIQSASQQTVIFDINGDADVDSYVEPGNTFTLLSTRGQAYGWGHVSSNSSTWRGGSKNGIIDGPSVVLHHSDVTKQWDFNKHGGEDNYRFGRIVGTLYKENTFFLLKILNDSIKTGTKGALDLNDYEVIDVVGKIETGTSVGWLTPWDGAPCFPDARGTGGNLQRLPKVYKGNPVSMGSFGYEGIETPESYDPTSPVLGDSAAFEWTYFDPSPSNFDIGHHALDVTVHKSVVNSTVYEVSKGFSASESLTGVIANTTVADFLANLIKLNDGQTLAVTSSTGAARAEGDLVQEGDILVVTSANAENETKYAVSVSGPLNSDVSLASTSLTVSDSEITGLSKTTTLRELKDVLSVNDLSSFYFVDKSGAILPLKMVNLLDTVYRDVVVTEDISVMVVAQSGATKLYGLNLGTTASDAFVTSAVYAVVEDEKEVSGVVDGANVETLLSNLVPSHNATVTVINRLGQERDFGILVKDDQVKVVSEDQSKTVVYDITLITETIARIVGVEETELPSVAALVSPNPTTGKLTISSNVIAATVYGLNGAVVKSVTEPSGELNISALANGVYILNLVDADGNVSVAKVIKE